MTEAILAQAQKLYREASEIVAEEVRLKKKSSDHLVRIVGILKHLYEVFQSREDPSKPLVLIPNSAGFPTFKDAMVTLLKPLGYEERMGWYCVSIGRLLLGKIPESELADMGFEKAKQLARVAKAKREIPVKILEQARDETCTAAKLHEEVDLLLYKGNSDHSEGRKRSLVLVGGEKLIRGIQKKIEQLRPAVTEERASAPASDAQVVEFALADCLAGVQQAEDHEMDRLKYGRGSSRHASQT